MQLKSDRSPRVLVLASVFTNVYGSEGGLGTVIPRITPKMLQAMAQAFAVALPQAVFGAVGGVGGARGGTEGQKRKPSDEEGCG